MILKAVTCYCS